MGSKALFLLVMFMVSILLTSTEEAPRDLDEKFDQNYGNNNNDPAQALDESKQYRGGSGRGFGGRDHHGGGYGGPWRGDGGSPWGPGGVDCSHSRCCVWNFYGCFKCCS
ncbi:hypothetical protein PIB30_017283 [Stylosanthes scabra]|uniref:Glycine-rich protein n=1 Tax=Stylosanthes scabra TaxID=79078 RepID=A0ABU6R7U6_9FABA|nr:hypothetical protein [Stylosanthes scabra]